jgi:hypothetical protein
VEVDMDGLANWSDAFIDEALAGGDAFGPLPPDLQGQAPRWAQEHGVQQVFRQLRGWFGNATPVQIDRQRQSGGVVVGRQRPDAQFNNPDRRGRPTYVEVDTERRRMNAHIRNRATGTRSVFLLVDPATGALVEKHIYPAGGGAPTIRRARGNRGLTLTRRDVFDDFDA